MFQPYTLFVGLRYTRAKRRNHFISFISGVSIVGVALGATTLITVLSVMNGFEKELRSRILGMTAHVTVSGTLNRGLRDWELARDAVTQNPEVIGTAPYIEGEGMLRRGRYFSGVGMRGIDPAEEGQVSRIVETLVEGSMDDLRAGEYGIVLGKALAAQLGAITGDKVDLMIPQASVTPAGVVPRFRRFTVVGVFYADMYEYDRSVALVHIADAQKLYRMPDEVSGLRVKLKDMFMAPTVQRILYDDLAGLYRVSNWTERHKNFFRAIATEKTVMFFILLLIIVIAAFNIVSALVMVVTEKQADIAILRTLGATPLQVMAIFMVQGTVVGLLGTLLGVSGGVLLSLNIEHVVPFLESMLGRQVLDPSTYVITELRGDLHWDDVWKTATAGFTLTFLSTLYPAWRASRVQPAEALRYE